MRCIVGLGNPGRKYFMSRHNIGFIVLDKLAEELNLEFSPSKFDFYKSEDTLGSSDFFLIKPTTYMNLSGTAVLDFTSNHHIPIENILVVYDDVNLPFGTSLIAVGQKPASASMARGGRENPEATADITASNQ